MTTVTITGATGNVGGGLAGRLLDAGVAVRAIGRSADRLAALGQRGAEPWVGDLTDAGFLARAFGGADAAFLMLPPSFTEPDFRAFQRGIITAFATALRQAGTPRLLTLSSIGADQTAGTGPIAGLHELEEAVNALDGAYVVHLRAGYFMENHLASVPLMKAQGLFGSAIAGDVAFAQVAAPDIAAHAATLFAPPTFTGRRVEYLIAPRDYSMNDAARIFGAAVGRPDLKYVTFPAAATRDALVGAGMTPDLASLYVEMMEGINAGRVRALGERDAASATPTSLERFAADVLTPAYRAA